MEKRGGWKTSRMTPLPKSRFGPPSYGTFSTPPQVSVLCFSCTRIHDGADQKLFWRGPKIFGGARSLVSFPPPVRFAPPPYHGPNYPAQSPRQITLSAENSPIDLVRSRLLNSAVKQSGWERKGPPEIIQKCCPGQSAEMCWRIFVV